MEHTTKNKDPGCVLTGLALMSCSQLRGPVNTGTEPVILATQESESEGWPLELNLGRKFKRPISQKPITKVGLVECSEFKPQLRKKKMEN
jgi:hypothetical protein